jgi:hypothetical protein
MITARLEGAAETVSGAGPPAPLPPPPAGPAPGTTTAPEPERQPTPAPKPEARSKSRPKAKAGSRGTRTTDGSDGGLADDVKDIGVGFAKDMLTTADGRRTLRTVFGALFGRK